MNDDYLWDGSGEPDPEVERLERLLGVLRHEGRAPDVPASRAAAARRPLGSTLSIVAAAAGLVLALGATGLATRATAPAWDFTMVGEAAGAGGAERAPEKRHLREGDWIETDASSRARIDVGSIGEVEIEPRTRVGLLDAGLKAHRLSLARGVLHARIWAPPGRFFVNTPSAVVVDLGCAYTLEVDDDGAGLVRVALGWVGFEFHGRESFVPAGAVCATRPGLGPGTPHFEDATEAFRGALAALDFGHDAGARAAALRAVLDQARRRDALSLWHLLARQPGPEREAVYDRMAALVPPPRGVTRDGVLRGDARMLDRWWEELGVGAVSWWRLWKSPWPPGR